jgi:hypothetical protein
MIYNPIKRRDSLIAGYVESQRGLAQSLNRQHDNFTGWLRWQIEKRETRMDTISLIGRESLDTEAAKTAGEAAAFEAVLDYINNGYRAE